MSDAGESTDDKKKFWWSHENDFDYSDLLDAIYYVADKLSIPIETGTPILRDEKMDLILSWVNQISLYMKPLDEFQDYKEWAHKIEMERQCIVVILFILEIISKAGDISKDSFTHQIISRTLESNHISSEKKLAYFRFLKKFSHQAIKSIEMDNKTLIRGTKNVRVDKKSIIADIDIPKFKGRQGETACQFFENHYSTYCYSFVDRPEIISPKDLLDKDERLYNALCTWCSRNGTTITAYIAGDWQKHSRWQEQEDFEARREWLIEQAKLAEPERKDGYPLAARLDLNVAADWFQEQCMHIVEPENDAKESASPKSSEDQS